jgi:hypothetical protein
MHRLFPKEKVRWLPIICIAAGLAYLLSTTWMRWGSLMVDTFRDFRVVQMILDGRVLYRDIFYEYGFLPPYFMSLLCLMTGVNIGTFAAVGIAMTILLVILVYKLSRIFMDRIHSTLAALTYLYVFAVAIYLYYGIFNCILPYSFASEFFVLFVVAALYHYLRFILTDRARHLWMWAGTMFLACLCRFDAPILVWAAFALASGLIWWFRREMHQGLRLMIVLLAVVPVLAVCSYGVFFATTHSWAGFNTYALRLLFRSPGGPFFKFMVGLDIQSMGNMFISLFYQVVSMASLAFASRTIVSSCREKRDDLLYGAIMVVLGVFSFAALYMCQDDLQYCCLPLLMGISFLVALYSLYQGVDTRRDLALCTLIMVTGSLVARLLFKIGPVACGFVWAVTAVVFYYFFFVVVLPKLWRRIWPDFPVTLYSAILLVFFVLLAGGYLKRSNAAHAQLAYRVLTEKGGIFTWKDDVTVKIMDAVRYLRTDTPTDATVTVLPECHSINFFSDRKDPLPFAVYMPMTFEMFGEDDMISRFRTAKVDYIVLVSRWTPEQGKRSFGIDYALRFHEWIRQNYTVAKQFGPYPFTSDEFGIAILKRNSAIP